MNKMELVALLKEDVVKLSEQRVLAIASEKTKQALDSIRLLKDCMALIKEYDWKDMHSEYEIKIDGKFVPVISIWKQDSDGNCKDHKMWERGREFNVPFKDFVEIYKEDK